jgi:Holliday junction resolvase
MTPYKRGRAKEWAVCKELRARGWQAVRSAGSHGLWDIAAVSPHGMPYYIQVKYTKNGGYEDVNLRAFRKLLVYGRKQAWIYTYGTKEPEIINL